MLLSREYFFWLRLWGAVNPNDGSGSSSYRNKCRINLKNYLFLLINKYKKGKLQEISIVTFCRTQTSSNLWQNNKDSKPNSEPWIVITAPAPGRIWLRLLRLRNAVINKKDRSGGGWGRSYITILREKVHSLGIRPLQHRATNQSKSIIRSYKIQL